ncbi:polysaccharide deacetylase family protein [Glycomyces sp. NRRL B-16210]|uniref:polysaccharide deacetylase family protein n=1 Tax=Glycomyces sp. NRRL B-16210 TaxID=1463821 RepID=UPI001415066C|nr:polysaccharide deacetylase family protein [Glycomyces sp. NRRL B-16210]
MGRNKIGIAAAAAALLLLAWVWPDGGDPPSGTLTATEPTASAAPTSASEGEETTSGGETGADTSVEGAPGDESAAPSSESVSPSAESSAPAPEAEPASNTYDGPLGTRNHTGTDAVALTFDDGPSPEWTPTVLAMLRERGIKAVFCVIGAYAEAYPEIIADIAREGHTLCNHAWFHEFDLGKWSEAEIRANLQRTNDAIVKAAPGAEVAYFRHPGGQWTERAIAVAADLGMESLHWAVDPSDWDNKTTGAQIEKHVLSETEPGAIVLLHDGASNQEDMCAALRSILDEFDKRGYAYTGL